MHNAGPLAKSDFAEKIVMTNLPDSENTALEIFEIRIAHATTWNVAENGTAEVGVNVRTMKIFLIVHQNAHGYEHGLGQMISNMFDPHIVDVDAFMDVMNSMEVSKRIIQILE